MSHADNLFYVFQCVKGTNSKKNMFTIWLNIIYLTLFEQSIQDSKNFALIAM